MLHIGAPDVCTTCSSNIVIVAVLVSVLVLCIVIIIILSLVIIVLLMKHKAGISTNSYTESLVCP